MDNVPTPTAKADLDHLNLLAIFHYVVGGIGFVFACLPLLHLAIGLALIFVPEKTTHGGDLPPAFVGYFFIVFAAIFILLGWATAICTILSGRMISQRRHWMFSLVMGCVLCMFMPFGTILGVFTIIVLNKESVKALYAQARVPPPA